MFLLPMFILLMVVELFEFCAETLSINSPPKSVANIRTRAKESFLMLVNSFETEWYYGNRCVLYSQASVNSIGKRAYFARKLMGFPRLAAVKADWAVLSFFGAIRADAL